MKIVATLLAGGATIETIREAIASAYGLVQRCLVIDTADRGEALELEFNTGSIECLTFPWTGSAADARNYSLTVARRTGYDWAMTLDADERMVFGNADSVHDQLHANAHCSHLLVEHESRTYSKERFFNLIHRGGMWTGPVHECFESPSPRATLTGITFSELTKTAKQQHDKDAHIISVLELYIDRHPTVPRWHFYLAESYRNLSMWGPAVEAYERCYNLNGWNEESAWACYLAADCSCKLSDLNAALKYCMLGLGRHGGIAELAWLASYVCYQQQRYREAVQWAQYSVERGAYAGDYKMQGRIGFRYVEALFEKPYEVLRFAYEKLGYVPSAARAKADHERALRYRTLNSEALPLPPPLAPDQARLK